jgi:UDP-N-acetyl-D-mannosaminuronate dehydrogenase
LEAYSADRKTRGRASRGYRREGELHLAPVSALERAEYDGFVYSLESSPSHTFVTSHGIVVHNCVPIDPMYLAWRVRGKIGHEFRLLETANDINQRMPPHVAQRAAEILNEEGKALRGAHVLLLGVAFKAGSGDVRESPALRVADRLARSGARITYHDPHVGSVDINGEGYTSADLTGELLRDADLVVVLADHPGVDYDLVLANAGCVYDTRGVTRRTSGGRARVHRS